MFLLSLETKSIHNQMKTRVCFLLILFFVFSIGIVNSQIMLSGRVEYGDTLTFHQAIINVKVILENTNGVTHDSTITDANGNYVFYDVPDGTYYIDVRCDKFWGGGGMSDALLIMLYWSGKAMLSGINLKAADVDASGTVNSLDALYIAKRMVFMINSFPAGDWIFERDTIIVNGVNVVHDIKGIYVGDVNASYSVPF